MTRKLNCVPSTTFVQVIKRSCVLKFVDLQFTDNANAMLLFLIEYLVSRSWVGLRSMSSVHC